MIYGVADKKLFRQRIRTGNNFGRTVFVNILRIAVNNLIFAVQIRLNQPKDFRVKKYVACIHKNKILSPRPCYALVHGVIDAIVPFRNKTGCLAGISPQGFKTLTC